MDDPREVEYLKNYKPSIDDLKMKSPALISELYYPKEFVEWKDKKELRYSSLHNRYYSDTDNGMREFTLDELFNYWKEDEQEEHPTNKEKFDGNYLPDPD